MKKLLSHINAFIFSIVALFFFNYLGSPSSFMSSGGDFTGSLMFTFLGIPIIIIGCLIPFLIVEIPRKIFKLPVWSSIFLVLCCHLPITILLFVFDTPRGVDSFGEILIHILYFLGFIWCFSLIYGIPLIATKYIISRIEPSAVLDSRSRGVQ